MFSELLLTKLHPASVHFPIAFLILSSLCGLMYLYWKPLPMLIHFTWTLMFLGWIGAIFACFTGLLAQSGLPPDAPYRDILNWHITTGLAQIVLYGALLYQRWRYPGLTQKQRNRMGATKKGEENRTIAARDLLDQATARWWITALLLAGMVLVFLSGWNGGRLVFEWGVNVLQAS